MEDLGIRYCQECGREILDDYGFCTACGWTYRKEQKSVPGSANVRTDSAPVTDSAEAARIAYQAMQEAFHQQVLENNRKFTVYLLEIWIGMVFFMVTGLASGSGQMFDSVKLIFGVGNHAVYELAIIGTSGALAMVSAILCSVKRHWAVAFATCLASTVVTALLIFFDDRMCLYFFLCGLITSLRVRNIRMAFSS